MNELKERIEGQLITRTFNVSGMPFKVFEEVDEFCKSEFGDNRWTMIHTLIKGQKEDYKFAMLYDLINEVKGEIAEIKLELNKPKENKKLKTFGSD